MMAMSIPVKERELREAVERNDSAIQDLLECLEFIKDSRICILREHKGPKWPSHLVKNH